MSRAVRKGAAHALSVLVGLGILAAAPAPAAAQADAPAGTLELVEIHFQGNETFADDSLAAAIVNRETHCKSFIFRITGLCALGLDVAMQNEDLIPEEILRDQVRLRIYYYQRGYREAGVDTALAVDGDEAELTFVIDEGRPVLVDSLAVVGLDLLPEGERGEVAGPLPLEEGDPLSGILLDAARDTLSERLWNLGYPRGDVLRSFFIPTDSPYSARVTYDIDPGEKVRYGEFVIEGNESLSERVIRRMLPFREGDVYDRSQIRDAQRSLYNLDIVRYATIDTVDEWSGDRAPLRVRIIEGDEHRVRVGAGWSTADCFNAEAGWTSRNFMGGARRLQLRTRVSNVLAQSAQSLCPQAGEDEFAVINGLVSAEFNQPWIFSSRNSLQASIFAERQSLPDVFVREALGGRIGLGRRIGRRTTLTLSYRPQLSRLAAAEIFFCTSFLICTPREIDILQSSNWLSPVALSLSRDRSDDLLDPTRGYVLLADLEHASSLTGSNFPYERVTGEVSWYQPLGGVVLATRLRVGWLGAREFEGLATEGRAFEIAHPEKRFYAGGANSVRGFAQNRLGPRVLSVDVAALVADRESEEPGGPMAPVCTPEEVLMRSCDPSGLGDDAFFPRPTGGTRVLEGNVEARFPLAGENLQGAAFVDFGQVWGESQSLGLGDVELTPGVGVRYRSPIGPIRIDLAYSLRGAERLPVITSGLRPLGPDEEASRCVVTSEVDDVVRCDVPWVRTDDLILLEPRVPFGDSGAFSLERLQLHFSIGQAF